MSRLRVVHVHAQEVWGFLRPQVQALWKGQIRNVFLEETEMEILKRAKSGGEVASFSENPENVKEEVYKRAKRAGYLQSREKISSGWTRRFEKNFIKIFGKE